MDGVLCPTAGVTHAGQALVPARFAQSLLVRLFQLEEALK
jgi:hypothetical protein